MSYFLLVVTFLMSNGYTSVGVEKFDTAQECFEAMQVVSQKAPTATVECTEIARGNR